MNNSSVMYTSKDKILPYNNTSNYKSNDLKMKINKSKPISLKVSNINTSGHNNSALDIDSFKNNINLNQIVINAIKKANTKKYSLTSINSKKNSAEKEDTDVIKKLNKLNFNGLLKNKTSSKNSAKEVNYFNNKKFIISDYFNLKKNNKISSNFIETFFKAPQNSNNKKANKIMKNNNYSSENEKTSNNNNNNQNQIINNTISPNNNFPTSNNSPSNNNKYYNTTKASPRPTFSKKQSDSLSHRINLKKGMNGNILSFYNNVKKNNIKILNCFLFGKNYNLENNLGTNKTFGQIGKGLKKKQIISVTSNFNNSNIFKNSLKSKIHQNNNFPKCDSSIRIKTSNFVTNSTSGNNNTSSNNSFVHKKVINPIMGNAMKSDNQLISNNIINNCQININNINYNNFNQKINNEKIMTLFKKKNYIHISKINKLFSHSQPEIIQNKKTKNKPFTSNNSPISKNSSVKKLNNKGSKESSINNSNKNTKSLNNFNKIKSKEKKNTDGNINNIHECIKANIIQVKLNSLDDENDKKEKIELDLSYKKLNNKKEINELKKNLLNKQNSIKSKGEKNEKDYNNISSNISSVVPDANYYMGKCKELCKYIKDYYEKNNKYPPTTLDFYLYGRLIGQGAFGKVNIGLNILTGRVVAIKSFDKKELKKNGDNMKKIMYETNLMKKLNHPNITKILEMFEDDNYILLAMEYINGGNLFSFVKKRRKLSEKTAKFLFRQIILGIKHIHAHKIVHRDIKLENILIDLNNNIKICDFGIGRILTSDKQLLHDTCGTPMYMAPEILVASKTHGYEGFPVDVWSCGISLYIMLSGTLPFNLKSNESSSVEEESNNNMELEYSIINKEPKYIEKISDEARDLLKRLLNKNPAQRITIDEILNHPWLKTDERNLKNNKNYHLFTKAEMLMLSKTYIDYRFGVIDDLKENFSISNLKLGREKKNGKDKKNINISTKSSLLDPYNTLIQNDDSISESQIEEPFNDINNPNINLEKDIVLINNKVKEYNLNYELNNNGECDNGMLINTKTGSINSSSHNTINIKSDRVLSSRSRRRNVDENDLIEDDLNYNDIEEQEEKQENKINKILDEIEKFGYKKEYVLKCVNENILCHASSIFYLMLNYKNI